MLRSQKKNALSTTVHTEVLVLVLRIGSIQEACWFRVVEELVEWCKRRHCGTSQETVKVSCKCLAVPSLLGNVRRHQY